MIKKFAYTKTFHFKSLLDYNIDYELKEKVISQFKIFDNEFKKVSLVYDLKNFISFDYVKKNY